MCKEAPVPDVHRPVESGGAGREKRLTEKLGGVESDMAGEDVRGMAPPSHVPWFVEEPSSAVRRVVLQSGPSFSYKNNLHHEITTVKEVSIPPYV